MVVFISWKGGWMFNNKVLDEWERIANLNEMMPSSVVIWLVKHAKKLQEENEKLKKSLEFWEAHDEEKEIKQDYYS